MLLVNLSKTLVNGARGQVLQCNDDTCLVNFDDITHVISRHVSFI